MISLLPLLRWDSNPYTIRQILVKIVSYELSYGKNRINPNFVYVVPYNISYFRLCKGYLPNPTDISENCVVRQKIGSILFFCVLCRTTSPHLSDCVTSTLNSRHLIALDDPACQIHGDSLALKKIRF
jgi:hypothetical protein